MGGEESRNYDAHYRDLFLELEETIRQAMQTDRMDRHSLTDREWTPPPKHYQDDYEPTSKPDSAS